MCKIDDSDDRGEKEKEEREREIGMTSGGKIIGIIFTSGLIRLCLIMEQQFLLVIADFRK